MRRLTLLTPIPEVRAIGAPASLWRGAVALLLLLGAGRCDAADARGRDLFHGAAPATGLTFTLSTNQAMYQPGALHVLSASLTSTIAVTADVYVVIQTPSGAVGSLLASGGSSPGVVPFLSGA